MQTALSFRTNRELFSNYYLDEHLPETEAWLEVTDEDLREAKAEIQDLWQEQKETAPQRNESQLEEKFIRPMFRRLGIHFEVEESVERGQRRPDYGFFGSREAANEAFKRRGDGEGFYDQAVAVADAKRWDRPLDTQGEHRHDFKNPSHQIHVYLQETPVRWAVLTNGRKWRLYNATTSRKLDSYYEIDLPTVLESEGLEAFKYFYLFFRHEAFLEDPSGDCFLDDVLDESNIFAQELGEDLQENIYEAIRVLSEGFLQYPENDLSEEHLEAYLPDVYDDFEAERLSLIHDSALIYLYRLIFVLYAESEGRELLDTDNEYYEERFSLNTLKQEVAEKLDSADRSYPHWDTELWDDLGDLFELIDQGSKSREIPEDELYIPAYNGGLFRTDPDEDDSREARFLDAFAVGDAHVAPVIDLLARSKNGNAGEKIFVDYSSLDIRHLGSIYEGLLEYQLNVAEEDLTVEDDEYRPVEAGDDVVVEVGDVYLTTDSGERKATGSYYTPEYVVDYIVENTLEPLVEEIRADLLEGADPSSGGFAEEFAERVFELKVLDPAMGSGHFLTSAVDYLAREIIDARERQGDQLGPESIEADHDIYWARRQVAQRCIYGVDLNPLATELAKVSLWLRTLAAEQPLAFLDHHLKTGNSLIGSDIEEVLDNGASDDDVEDGQLTLHESFDRTRRQALDHVTDRFQALMAIDNETLADIKEMEAVFDEVSGDPLYRHLLAMANVHTADAFGLDMPLDAYERMATALRDESWGDIEEQDWFRSAQALAQEVRFFHWELEFPVAFYRGDGERDEDAGFDAVIGNPPYIRSRNLPGSLKEYYKNEFRTAKGAFDIYIPFLERAASLGERNGFIVPNKWTTTDYGETLRDLLLDEYSLNELTDVSHIGVFPDADIYPLVIIYTSKADEENQGPTIRKVIEPAEIGSTHGVTISKTTIEQLGGRVIPINLSPELQPIINKGLSQPSKLGDHIEMTEAIHTGNVRDKLVVDEKMGSECEKLADGKSIDRYHVRWSGKWVRYDESLIDEDKGEYGDLRTRELFDKEAKLFIRDISYRPVAAYDENQLFALNTLYSVSKKDQSDLSLKYLLTIFNSQFVNCYFRMVYGGTHVSGDYLRFKPMFSYNIPIPSPDCQAISEEKIREVRDFIPEFNGESPELALIQLGDVVREGKEQKSALNLSLLQYLGNYAEGHKLPDIGLFQPISTDILDATTEDHEKLNIGEVRTERDGSTVTIYATARYKPEAEDEHETDRNGYTETDPLEVFTLADLSENEAALVEAFVPVAVEEGNGFAGFRDNATKTISLLDRLKAITLPDLDDVEDDLRRYLENKKRADELDDKIRKTDRLIDDIVYELYDLTDEEIEIVEEAVGNE